MRLKSFEKLKSVSGSSKLKIATPEKAKKYLIVLEQIITLWIKYKWVEKRK